MVHPHTQILYHALVNKHKILFLQCPLFFSSHPLIPKSCQSPVSKKSLSYGPNSQDIQLGKSQKLTFFYWILQDRVRANGLLPFRVFMVESATDRFSLRICAPLWCSYGIPPLCTCFLIAKNEEGLTFYLLSWALPVDLTRDKFRLSHNDWQVTHFSSKILLVKFLIVCWRANRVSVLHWKGNKSCQCTIFLAV